MNGCSLLLSWYWYKQLWCWRPIFNPFLSSKVKHFGWFMDISYDLILPTKIIFSCSILAVNITECYFMIYKINEPFDFIDSFIIRTWLVPDYSELIAFCKIKFQLSHVIDRNTHVWLILCYYTLSENTNLDQTWFSIFRIITNIINEENWIWCIKIYLKQVEKLILKRSNWIQYLKKPR